MSLFQYFDSNGIYVSNSSTDNQMNYQYSQLASSYQAALGNLQYLPKPDEKDEKRFNSLQTKFERWLYKKWKINAYDQIKNKILHELRTEIDRWHHDPLGRSLLDEGA